MKKRTASLLIAFLLVFCLASCVTGGGAETTTESEMGAESVAGEESTSAPVAEMSSAAASNGGKIDVQIGSTVLTATLEDNASARAFVELLRKGEVTVYMHDYGKFEKTGTLPQSIATNDEQITTRPGDIILYQANQITIYYDTNSWSLTRLGKIDNVTQAELKALLGEGNVTVTFRLHREPLKVLVAYFSVTGTTKTVAGHIKDAVGAELYEITPSIPYTAADLNYSDSNCRTSREMNTTYARPAISGEVENMEDYDVIFIGYPIWYGQEPRIINTFIESYDFSDKILIPFCTSGGSGISFSAENLRTLLPDVTWKEGKRFAGNTEIKDIYEWAKMFDLGSTD